MLLLSEQPKQLLHSGDGNELNSSRAKPAGDSAEVAADSAGVESEHGDACDYDQQAQRPAPHGQAQQAPHVRLIGLQLSSLSAAFLRIPEGRPLSQIRVLNLHANSLESLEVGES